MFDDDPWIDRALRSFALRGLQHLFNPKGAFFQRHGERVPRVEHSLGTLERIMESCLSEAGFKTPEQAQRARVRAGELLLRLRELMEEHARHETRLLAVRRSAERIATLESEMRSGSPLRESVDRRSAEVRALRTLLGHD